MSQTEKTVNDKKPEKPEISADEQLDFEVLDEIASEHEQTQNPEPEKDEPQIQTKELLAPIIHGGFSILAPNWKVEKTESGMLAEVYANLLDKYFPEGVHNKFGIEIAAITCTIMVVAPRMKVPRKAEKEKAKKPEKTVNDFGADMQVSPESNAGAKDFA